jgi:hypothetical protein
MDAGSKRSVPADYEDFTEDLSFLKMLEIPLLIRILKEEASEENPMSAALISENHGFKFSTERNRLCGPG